MNPPSPSATPRRPRVRHARYSTGTSANAPVCLAKVATAMAAPADSARPRRARSTAAVIAGSMKISKLAAWPSWGANATSANTHRSPAIHDARRPYRRRASSAMSNAVSAAAPIASTRTDHRSFVSNSSNEAAYTYGTSGGLRSAASS